MTDVVTAMIEAGCLTPSIHNSQPWRFRVHGDRVEVLADRSRSTPAMDPTGRGLHIACGAAVLNAVVTARAAGRACAVTIGDSPGGDDLIATLQLAGDVTSTPEDVLLAAAVARRHTVRTPFEPRPVPAELVEQLRAGVERDGAWLAVLSRPEDVVELAVLTQQAAAAEAADVGYRTELQAWLRGAADDMGDGIPADLVRGQDRERGSDVALRDFVLDDPRSDLPAEDPPVVERPLLVVLGTDGDREGDWVLAGIAMQRLWLTATVEGLGASPMTQALDHASFRSRLGGLLGLENGHPQMLLRLGFSTPQPTTGRRALADVLVPS